MWKMDSGGTARPAQLRNPPPLNENPSARRSLPPGWPLLLTPKGGSVAVTAPITDGIVLTCHGLSNNVASTNLLWYRHSKHIRQFLSSNQMNRGWPVVSRNPLLLQITLINQGGKNLLPCLISSAEFLFGNAGNQNFFLNMLSRLRQNPRSQHLIGRGYITT